MAKTFEVRSWCDQDEPRTVEATEELYPGLDGEWYEVDLCADHAKEARAAIQLIIDAGRLAERAPKPPKRLSPREESIRYNAGLREYALASYGLKVGPGDYVTKPIRDEYEAIAGKAPVWRKADPS